MGATLTLSILEIILLFFGAIILGITIHFTIASRRTLRASMSEKEEVNKFRDEWKSRYFNDIELKDKELSAMKEQINEVKLQATSLKQQLAESEENVNIYSIEAEEMRKENKLLMSEIDQLRHSQPAPHIQPAPVLVTAERHPDYLEQLRMAQSSLMEQNEKINQLLGNIDVIKETEEKQREILKNNEELSLQIAELRGKLQERENEINNARQKEHLTKEMTSMLDNAYSEFNVLQSKMQKLELQVSSSRMINMEYEDLKESHQKIMREFEEQKLKLSVFTSDNQQMRSQLIETEEKLRESNFQRQQLQKRIAYLEELNNDMQAVNDANKKLEGQLKRIGELESMLNVVAEERDQLVKKSAK
jgi:chromosome segregation ATPase